MGLTIALEPARVACAESVDAFVAAVDGLTELELLAASRCHGWTRLDVVVHVIAGWQELLGGLVSPVDGPPTVDAGSYWTAFAEEYGDEDPVATLMAQRRRTAAYSRPAAALAHLHDVADTLRRGIASYADVPHLWQGHVFAPGDFLAIWAVEHVVHHLDLSCPTPAPASGLALSRATIEALAGGPLPGSWDDETATLVGSGRLPAPDGGDEVVARLPVLG